MALRKTTLAAASLATLLTAAFAADNPADRTAIRQPPQRSIAPTIEVYGRETFVDIVVTDAKGRPVHGLKQSDFTILEDGKEMSPKSFEEHRSDDISPSPIAAILNLPPNTFTNLNPTPTKAGPPNILLIDSLNIQGQEQGMVWKQVLEFINKIPPGTRMAVFSLTSSHLSILQGFTTDPELLKAAINSKKLLPMPSALEDPFQDPFLNTDLGPPWFIVDQEGDMAAMRAQYELSGMTQIARYLSGIPGRKNLIWFTGSFPLQFPEFPDNGAFPPHPGESTRAQSYDLSAEMKSATDLLARAHVAVYPIDGRGLQVLPLGGFVGANRNDMNIMEHGTMDDIADQTGGKAFYNTNGFTEAVEQAIDNGSNFYTLTYVPTNHALDTRFRKITVKVNQPGLHLTYRDGYYAVDPSVDARGKPIEKINAMQTALLRGSLDATEIPFRVQASPASATEVSLPTDNQPNPKQMKPPYRRVSLSYLIDIAHMTFTPGQDGNYRGAFEFGVRVYNPDGDEIVNAASKEVRPILPPAVYQSMLKNGATAHLEIAVPAKGDFFLRVAVHDLTSDRVGAVEVPTTSIHSEPTPALATAPNH